MNNNRTVKVKLKENVFVLPTLPVSYIMCINTKQVFKILAVKPFFFEIFKNENTNCELKVYFHTLYPKVELSIYLTAKNTLYMLVYLCCLKN